MNSSPTPHNQSSRLIVIGRAEEPEQGVFGSLEPEPIEKRQKPGPEPLGKKSGDGAGA